MTAESSIESPDLLLHVVSYVSIFTTPPYGKISLSSFVPLTSML